MNNILMTTMLLGALLAFGANQPVEARSSFSLYLGGGPSYVAPYYVEPRYYVEPAPRYYYVEPEYYYYPRYYRPYRGYYVY